MRISSTFVPIFIPLVPLIPAWQGDVSCYRLVIGALALGAARIPMLLLLSTFNTDGMGQGAPSPDRTFILHRLATIDITWV